MKDLAFHIEQLKREPIYAILGEPQSLGRTNLEVAEHLLKGGIKVLQYRDKTKTVREKYEQCLAIKALTEANGATFIVNDSVDLALAVQADGIHVGQKDLPVEWVRKLGGTELLIGVSINYVHQWEEAYEKGVVNYIGLGPFFQTTTKKDAEPLITEELKKIALLHDENLPCVPIGGINEQNVLSLYRQGWKRFAMISDLVGAEAIEEKVESLHRLLLTPTSNT